MFVTGLTGGFGHCIGMCGPLVASYSVALGGRSMLPHVLYHAGRVTTYALMGTAAGLAGSFVGVAGRIEALQRGVMLAAGAGVVLMGFALARLLPGMKRLEKWALTGGLVSRVTRLFSGSAGAGACYPLGLVLGFIPCGLVYTALLAAARAAMEARSHAAGLLTGGGLMLVFGLGTTPSLLLFGRLVHEMGARLRGRLYRLSGLVMVALGVWFIWRAL
jgi:sulfite exporter TauE/SafE